MAKSGTGHLPAKERAALRAARAARRAAADAAAKQEALPPPKVAPKK